MQSQGPLQSNTMTVHWPMIIIRLLSVISEQLVSNYPYILHCATISPTICPSP